MGRSSLAFPPPPCVKACLRALALPHTRLAFTLAFPNRLTVAHAIMLPLSLLPYACDARLQYGTIDYGAVVSELPIQRDPADGTFLAIPGLAA